ncbi:MAG TPA: efflux RND transporter periplasmic adaptor subunit [Candidatus Acidoferrales bacterium]|nr:efflux RND transporter periplasmic adaptor subunit [Candidatus Acidoferrales bacterium]
MTGNYDAVAQPTPERFKLRRLIASKAVVLSFALTGVLLACGCGPDSAKRQPAAPPAVAVTTQVVQPVSLPNTSEYLATLKSRSSATVNPQVEGWIFKIYVKSGQRVSAGAPLMEIDPRVQQATVQSQEAARNAQAATLANAESQYKRAQSLYSSGIISKQDFDTIKATYDTAVAQEKALDAQLQQQQVQLRYYNVTAPTGGIVGDIPVHVGDRVTNTTLLTTVDEPGALEAYIYVPVEHSRDLRRGESVDLLDQLGKVVAHSTIFFVSPQVDDATQTVLAKAAISNPGDKLRNLEMTNARITWGVSKGLVVPVLAVSRINGQFFVFVAEPGPHGPVARQRQIQVGDIVGNDYVALSGINPGDHVVTSGFQFLVDGAALKETVSNAPAAPASH